MGAPPALPEAVTGYRKVPTGKFRHSSVRGDFRVYKTASGILVSWKTLLSARTLDGAQMWKRENQGRAVAVSPDGTRIVTNNDDGETLILDAKTGEPVAGPVSLGGSSDSAHAGVYISAFAWTADAKSIVAVDSVHVYLLDAKLAVQSELKLPCGDSCFFASAAGVSNDEILLANAPGSSGSTIYRVHLPDGKIVKQAEFYGHDIDLSKDGKTFAIDGDAAAAVFDTASLAPVWQQELPGYRGVQPANWSEGSYAQWKTQAKLSPNGKYVAINDVAGRLWLLDAKTGAPVLAYTTELVDLVEDVMWLDDATLIAIDNPGNVLRISGTPAKVAWTQMDGPADGKFDE